MSVINAIQLRLINEAVYSQDRGKAIMANIRLVRHYSEQNKLKKPEDYERAKRTIRNLQAQL